MSFDMKKEQMKHHKKCSEDEQFEWWKMSRSKQSNTEDGKYLSLLFFWQRASCRRHVGGYSVHHVFREHAILVRSDVLFFPS
jgi:hypothetical protein